MPQIRRILFPVDYSESCVGAARYVQAFAGHFEAEVTLLHVASTSERTFLEDPSQVQQAQLDAFLASELKYFTTYRKCATGDPAMKIVETAASWHPDLVMIPTRGLGYFRRHLLGSVTAKVLHDLQCPIWTSVHAELAPRLDEIHCRRVLCAVNNTSRNRCILQFAAWLTRELQGTLGIAHATEKTDAATFGWYWGNGFEGAIVKHAKEHVAALQAEVGTDAQVYTTPGDPAKAVACAAKDFKADVVIIGRHSASSADGHVFQHAYAILRESPCPVISI